MTLEQLTTAAVFATIEATERGYIVWLRDSSGRTIGDEIFRARLNSPNLGASVDAAYAAAAAYADRVNGRA